MKIIIPLRGDGPPIVISVNEESGDVLVTGGVKTARVMFDVVVHPSGMCNFMSAEEDSQDPISVDVTRELGGDSLKVKVVRLKDPDCFQATPRLVAHFRDGVPPTPGGSRFQITGHGRDLYGREVQQVLFNGPMEIEKEDVA